MSKKLLKDCAYYVTDRISSSNLTAENYIGVDNMLPNKSGVTLSESVPTSGDVTAFNVGDILIGNIRPYFKKIWLATFDGGCSPDVLCIRCNRDVPPEYLYGVLSQDSFFDYDMAGSKGSKMPRGDKNHIMNYPIPILNNMSKIGNFIIDINAKISNNNRINSELESMAKTIYDYWFTQFDFPDENGKPYKSSGGKMVWNEELKREIPEGWEVVNLESFINVVRGVSYSSNEVSADPKEDYVPLLKSNNLQNGRLILDDIIYVPKANVADNQYLSNNSVFVTMSSGSTEHVGKTALIPFDTEYCYGAFCSKIEIKPEFRCFISCFFLSDYFKRLIRTIVIGTSIKNISNEHLTNNLIAIPTNTDNYIINSFEKLINPLFDKQAEIIKENQQLASLRDWLLPMLMNGQVGFEEE